jgi:hypothetical protein
LHCSPTDARSLQDRLISCSVQHSLQFPVKELPPMGARTSLLAVLQSRVRLLQDAPDRVLRMRVHDKAGAPRRNVPSALAQKFALVR